MSIFRKPATVRYVYVPAEDFESACMGEPEAVVLLTSEQSDTVRDWERRPVDRPFRSIEQFPPAWLYSDASWYPRRWRYKMVTCRDYLSSPFHKLGYVCLEARWTIGDFGHGMPCPYMSRHPTDL